MAQLLVKAVLILVLVVGARSTSAAIKQKTDDIHAFLEHVSVLVRHWSRPYCGILVICPHYYN